MFIRKMIIVLVFPIIYSLNMMWVYLKHDNNGVEVMAYFFGFLTMPMCLAIGFVFDQLGIYDGFGLYINGIAGTIQYGALILFVLWFIKRKNQPDKKMKSGILHNEMKRS